MNVNNLDTLLKARDCKRQLSCKWFLTEDLVRGNDFLQLRSRTNFFAALDLFEEPLKGIACQNQSRSLENYTDLALQKNMLISSTPILTLWRTDEKKLFWITIRIFPKKLLASISYCASLLIHEYSSLSPCYFIFFNNYAHLTRIFNCKISSTQHRNFLL